MAGKFIVEQNTAEEVLERLLGDIEDRDIIDWHGVVGADGIEYKCIHLKERSLDFTVYDYNVLKGITCRSTNMRAREIAQILCHMLARPTLQREIKEAQEGRKK